ncbi:hypothetical protein ROS217_20617 [Roseovarius sp. 217]|nr:hypothetical protein ROS217_20617 [Roseovarius sp. 217]
MALFLVAATLSKGCEMQQLRNGYQSASVLLQVNADLLLYLVTLGFALFAGGFIGAL